MSKSKRRWNYGIGSVYTRRTTQGQERWYIEYYAQDKRVRRIVKSAQTRSEAVIALQETVAQEFSATFRPGSQPTIVKFDELAEMYIEDYAKINKKSWMDDKYRIDAHMKPYFGKLKIQDVNPQMIERYRAGRLRANASKSTVNREITILKRMYNLAIDWSLIEANPFIKVRLFSEMGTERQRILTYGEEERLQHACPEYLRRIVVTALNTGMRRGEILGLTWRQVDLERGEITVENTKSGKNRIIPISPELNELFVAMRKDAGACPLVFPNPRTGKPYTDVKKSFKGACSDVGIDDLRFHDLRHTFATRLIENGVDIITVRDLLGHFSIRVTQRYTHSNRNQKRDAVMLLSQRATKNAENQERLAPIWHTGQRKILKHPANSSFSMN